MILLEINPVGVTFVEFESDAPRAIDVDRVAGWYGPSQGLKIKLRKIHLFRHGCGVKTIEPDQDTSVHLDADLGLVAASRP